MTSEYDGMNLLPRAVLCPHQSVHDKDGVDEALIALLHRLAAQKSEHIVHLVAEAFGGEAQDLVTNRLAAVDRGAVIADLLQIGCLYAVIGVAGGEGHGVLSLVHQHTLDTLTEDGGHDLDQMLGIEGKASVGAVGLIGADNGTATYHAECLGANVLGKGERFGKRRTGTVIVWKPDLEVFTDINIPYEYFTETMRKQAVVNAGLRLCLKFEHEDGKFEQSEYFYKEGIIDYVREMLGEAQERSLSQDSDEDADTDGDEDEETDGVVQVYSDIAASVVEGGKIVASLNDAVQPKVSFNVAGEITKKDFKGTKRELKENYGMSTSPYSPDNNGDGTVKEWYVQSAAFSAHVVGKTAAEVEALATKTLENGYVISSDDALLGAGCTIQITGIKAVVAKSVSNAR